MHLRSKYPDTLFDLDGIGKQMDMSEFSRKFFSSKVTADASIDANANVSSNSVIAYMVELPKPFFRLNSYYVLWKELKRLYGLETANSITEMNVSGDIYIHDLHGIGGGVPYCFNYSTYDILTKGLCMSGKVKSVPPKHLHSFKSQLEQFVIIASNSTLGATGLADLFITMAYYVARIIKSKSDAHFRFLTEDDCWVYVREMLDSFIYSVNFDLRANQSPFTNVSVYDRYFLESVCENYIFPDGTSPDISIVEELQRIYLKIMNEELERVPLTFPVTTACFSVDDNNNILDRDFLELISKENLKFGFINIYCGKSSTLSSCCRLRSERKNEYFNSFGSGSTKIGSLGVCSINMPRLSYKYKDEESFINALKDMVGVCARVNHAKRKVIDARIKNGNEPLYTHDFMDINKQYSTVGVNGMNECLEQLGYDILTESGQDLAVKIITAINNENDKYERQYKYPHNCEQVPGENMSIKMASKDRVLKYQDEYNIYSNQFIPLTTSADLLDRIKIQGLLDKYFSGGSILHINVDTPIEDYHQIMDLIEATAKQGVIYHAINYVLQECSHGHFTVGRADFCPTCKEDIVNQYTRVVGFLTNVKNWHRVRREQDFPNRQFYSEVNNEYTRNAV